MILEYLAGIAPFGMAFSLAMFVHFATRPAQEITIKTTYVASWFPFDEL
jgi:hypothetical protein